MKAFFIKFWNVMMYSSFISAAILLLIFLSSLGIFTPNYGLDDAPTSKYNPSGGVPWYQSIEMIVEDIFNYLNIDFQPTSLQIFLTLISLCLLSGIISRAIIIKLEH